MLLEENVLAGTLKPDGTLVLDEVPTLPAGRVTIVLRPQGSGNDSSTGWWEYARQSHEDLVKNNTKFMNDAEVQSYIESLRESDAIDEWLHKRAS